MYGFQFWVKVICIFHCNINCKIKQRLTAKPGPKNVTFSINEIKYQHANFYFIFLFISLLCYIHIYIMFNSISSIILIKKYFSFHELFLFFSHYLEHVAFSIIQERKIK